MIPNFELRHMKPTSAKLFMRRWHYTHTCGNIVCAHGFYVENRLSAIVSYTPPVGRHLPNSILENGIYSEFLELQRLFTHDRLPKNSESKCVSMSLKRLKQDYPKVVVVVSYADSGAGHVGYVYQATNWIYTGKASNELKIFIDGKRVHRRSLVARYGTSGVQKLKSMGLDIRVSDERFHKHRYIFVLASSKRERKRTVRRLKVTPLPYPKGNIRYYDCGASCFDKIEG